MIFRRIAVSNAGPFLGDWEVRLNEGVNAIVGEYEGAPESSNRGGKSWLATTAPYYALYGAIPIQGAGVNDVPHVLAAKEEDAWVELEVETSSGATRIIRRGRKAGGDPIRLLDGVQVSETDMTSAVYGEILGLNHDEYEATGMAIQEQLGGFLSMRPGDRRALVAPWLNIDRWSPRHELASERLKVARAELAAMDAELSRLAIDTKLPDLESRLEKVDSDLAHARKAVVHAQAVLAKAQKSSIDPEPLSQKVEDLRRQAKGLEKEREAVNAQKRNEIMRAEQDAQRAEALAGELRASLGRSAQWKNRINELQEKLGTVEGLDAEIVSLRTSVETYRKEIADISAERDQLRSEYDRLKDNLTGVCPLLHESCDRVSDTSILTKISKRGKGLVAERNSKVEALDLLKPKLQDAEMRRDSVVGWMAELAGLKANPVTSTPQSKIEAAVEAAAEAQRHIQICRAGSPSVRSALTRIGETEADLIGRAEEADKQLKKALLGAPHLQQLQSAVVDATRAQDTTQSERGEIVALVAAERKRLERIEELRVEREEMAILVRQLAWAAFAFGPTGIPAREMETAFGVVTDQINGALEALQVPQRVVLQPSRELQSWEPTCTGCGEAYPKGYRGKDCPACGVERSHRREEDFDLKVQDGTREFTAARDSGGGKTLLAIATRLGLAQVPGSRRAVRCEHLIVDEPDGALDAPNRRALHHLLASGNLAQFGVKQVILVTHADVRDEFPQTIIVHRWADEERSGCWNA